MVLLLSANVAPDPLHRGFADREDPVAFLPIERVREVRQVVDPFGGLALDLLEHVRDGDVGLEFGEEMNVIGGSTNFEENPSFAARVMPPM